MTTKDKTKNKIVSSLDFEKDPDTELPLPKIPRNKGTPLFEEDSEHTTLLYNPREKHGLVNESALSTTGGGAPNSKIILQEYDYDRSEAKTYTEPSTNICLAICSTFFCFVVGMFAISHSVQAHYYKEAGLLSLADAHGSKAAHLAVVAIIMGLIIVMWVTILRIMLLSSDS
ncbi:hypothetical protein ACHWQZ_G015604 [Mnemiopsis leidyi]